jgi:hypothetical protein
MAVGSTIGFSGIAEARLRPRDGSVVYEESWLGNKVCYIQLALTDSAGNDAGNQANFDCGRISFIVTSLSPR